MSEKTKIVQCFLPPMVAGEYTLDVTQNIVKGGSSVQDVSKKFDFAVDAARFALNPTDIYSVYPPANQYGNYSESLPHIVFSRRTLPWERTLDGELPLFLRATSEEKKSPAATPPIPWMALILFDEDEMKTLKIKTSTVADVIQVNTSKEVTRPEIYLEGAGGNDALELMPWETENEGCYTIDISKEQFETHIPSKEGLSYLAHAKEVSVNNKDQAGITDVNSDGAGVFAVMVGNRLPSPGKQHTAILVSLEGYQDYLSDAKSKKSIPNGNKVRLVVLAHWNFSSSGDATFLQLVDGLDTKAMRIERDNEAAELVPFFESGYAPLAHRTRKGASMLSWYHGPFSPKMTVARSKSISFASSDAALRYDRNTGFFDVSFAAAWQLGRMLALQNQEFAKAMLGWRIDQKEEEVRTARRKSIGELIGDASNASLKDKVIGYLGKINEVTVTPSEVVATQTTDDIPDNVKHFLGELYKLNGVPFSYLVPHEFLLPKDHKRQGKEFSGSLAMFYIDPSWVEALLDGALSIGRIDRTDTILERVMTGEFTTGYIKQKIKDPEDNGQDIEVRQLNLTGFLFRSNLISGWRGIEIEAYDADKKPLLALRFEQINDDVFLGIFNGNVHSMKVRQPYEGLHFGIKRTNNAYSKSLKDANGKTLTNINDTINTLIKGEVINIVGMANAMKAKLNTDEYFTSAEFAFQMVDSPVERELTVNLISNPPR